MLLAKRERRADISLSAFVSGKLSLASWFCKIRCLSGAKQVECVARVAGKKRESKQLGRVAERAKSALEPKRIDN